MGLIWFGGEDIDFPGTTPVVVGGNYRSGWARCSVRSTSTNSGAAFSKTFACGAVTSAWLGFRMNTSEYGWNPNMMLCGLIKLGTNGKGLFVQGRGSGVVGICKSDGQGNWSYLGTPSGIHAIPDNQIVKFDMEVANYNGTGCMVNVYINGSVTPAATFIGDARATGISDLDGVAVYGEPWGNTGCASEIIVANEDTRAMFLATLGPAAAGDQNEWTGGYDAIDEVSQDDNDVVYADAVDKSAQFNLSNVPAGSFSVLGIAVKARAAKVGAIVNKLMLGVKSAAGSGGVDLDAGQALDIPFNTLERYMAAVNGAELTTSDIDALQIAFKSAA